MKSTPQRTGKYEGANGRRGKLHSPAQPPEKCCTESEQHPRHKRGKDQRRIQPQVMHIHQYERRERKVHDEPVECSRRVVRQPAKSA